jgi:hypothetical protein
MLSDIWTLGVEFGLEDEIWVRAEEEMWWGSWVDEVGLGNAIREFSVFLNHTL